MTLYKWSQTASADATADSTINWAEGQSPSSVNDSARGMMAATAKYRDDIAGAIVTGGTSTAYTVSSYQVFDTLAHLAGQMIAFTPHATNGATVTLNVDGLGAKPLRSAPSTELLAGTIILGTPYVAVYNNTDAVWYLQGFYGNPYSIPLGGMLPYAGTSAPNSSFAFPYGQAVSRVTYAPLFSQVSTNFGVGDGSATFNLPDLRGRVVSAPDNMGGTNAGRTPYAYTAGYGAQTVTLATANMPAHNHGGVTGNDSPDHTHAFTAPVVVSNVLGYGGGPNGSTQSTSTFNTGGASARHTHTIASEGSGTAFSVLPPSIALNFILRII